MVIDMNEDRLMTLPQSRKFVEGTTEVEFRRCGKDEDRHPHIEGVLRRFGYARLKRADKGLVLRYLMRTPANCDRSALRSHAVVDRRLSADRRRDARSVCTPARGGRPLTGERRPLGDPRSPHLPASAVASTRDSLFR